MAAQLTRLETRTKEFNMHASCWDYTPASAVKASHGSAMDLARSGHLALTGQTQRIAAPSRALVAVVEVEHAR